MKRRDWRLGGVFAVVLGAVGWSLYSAGVFRGDLVNAGGWGLVGQFLAAASRPEVSAEFLLLTCDATLKTLAFAVCGTFFSLIVGFVGGIFCSEVWWESVLGVGFGVPWLAIRALLAVPRAIHELIWGLFLINIFGLDPLVAVLAIAIPFGAITAKVFAEILDETPRQPMLALLGSGVPPLSAFLYGLIPLAFPNWLAYAFYRFECSIRAAAVLGIIGAGGLGYQIYLSLQSLRYEEMWTLLLALVVLSGGTDLWSGLLRRRIGAPSRLDLNVLQVKPVAVNNYRAVQGDRVISFSLFCVAVLILFSFWYVQADFSKLWIPRTGQLLLGVIAEAFPPDFSQLGQLVSLCNQTLAMSILAIAFAGCGGIIFSFLAANNLLLPGGILDAGGNSNRWWGITVLVLSRLLLLFTRAIPAPIWALIFLFVLFPGILPGAIALGIHNLGILGRLMAEVTENLDDRPSRSLTALGASSTLR